MHAEGYPAGEMKHGPLALIEEGLPVVILAPKDRYFEKTISNMQEVIARGGQVILISNDNNNIISENVRSALEIPKTDDFLTPFLMTIPLQLLAYHVASLKNYDIDRTSKIEFGEKSSIEYAKVEDYVTLNFFQGLVVLH